MNQGFSKKLRKARESKGLTQSELAEKSGMKPSAISHFESGRRRPSFDNLKKLADALNVNIDFLLDREPKSGVVGPNADKLFRNFEKLSDQDQETLSSFAEMLAQKNKDSNK
jgi:transcriptional regulator with XRE-family HTH domain